ncbi:MAG: hypothetical protein AAFY76_11200 [Cyanobacteria bacterium J06649_11]
MRFPLYVSFPDNLNREQKHQYGWFARLRASIECQHIMLHNRLIMLGQDLTICNHGKQDN